jgi:hypothetical protein
MAGSNQNIRATVKDRKEVRVRSSLSIAKRLSELTNIDMDEAETGAVLVYNAVSTDWKATRTLNQQNVDGGEF